MAQTVLTDSDASLNQVYDLVAAPALRPVPDQFSLPPSERTNSKIIGVDKSFPNTSSAPFRP